MANNGAKEGGPGGPRLSLPFTPHPTRAEEISRCRDEIRSIEAILENKRIFLDFLKTQEKNDNG